MDAHRVHVLDGADDYGVARLVAHHLHLVLLPADQRLLDENFVVERRLKAASDNPREFLRVVRDSAAGAAEREARTHDERPRADGLCDCLGFCERMGASRARHVEADVAHRLLEEVAVFGAFDCLGLRADELNAVALQDASLVELHREVERRLSAKRRQDRVWPFAADYFVQVVGRQRLDVRPVGAIWVGHHRRGVGVHEHDFVAERFKRLHGLHAGIVELAALADDDWPGTDDKYLSQIRAFHFFLPFRAALTRPLNSGCGIVGRDLNSGWNCEAMK